MSKQQRSQKFKTEPVISADESSLVTSSPEGTDPETLPFPEWSDQDVNMEKWDNAPTTKDKIPSQQKSLYEDPQEVHLPPSLGAHQWKRCSEIFPDANFVIFINKSTYPDLVTPNHHLLHSEFYRSFISSIEVLLYIGSSKLFPEEYGSSLFSAASDRAWRPWHHIYSNCKIVKGHNEHSPLYNPAGKYIVRLYWMGAWRKIYVDDLIPVDKSNCILLPILHVPKTKSQVKLPQASPEKSSKSKAKSGSPSRKEIIELWPMILCKALLKIGCLSWSTEHELYDYDIINCLTGWVPQRIKIKDISSSDLWDIFTAYVQRFEWEELKEGSAKKTGSTKSKSKGTEKAEPPKKGQKAPIPSGIEFMQDGDRHVVVSCDNFETAVESDKYFQNKNIAVLISQVRDIPIIKPPPRPELEFWKKFRYEEWAVQQGIIPPDIPKLNIKSLKIVDPFKRIFESLQELERVEEKTQDCKDTENIDKKSEKSSKSSKKEPKMKNAKHHLEPDPTTWVDFDRVKENINHLTIYFQPRSFKAKTKISDINFVSKSPDVKNIIYSNDLKEIRNEPLYLFMDSIDYKFLAINYAQVGNDAMLEKYTEGTETDSIKPQTLTSEDICMEILLKKTTLKEDDKSVSQISTKSMLLCSFNTKPINFVLEEYCWASNSFGRSTGFIVTVNNKSLILALEPGRKSFRLWISSHCSYVLQVFSDTPMTIGYLEEYTAACTAESQLLTNLCYELSSCFGKLVQSFGLPDHSIGLRNFYQCYKPFETLTKKELATLHNAVLEELFKVIKNNSLSSNALECIRLLFLQLKTFDYINPYTEESHLYGFGLNNLYQVDYAKMMERGAVKIQSFFKGSYIRLLMRKMNENHKEYSGIFDNLKKVYSEIFSFDKRLNFIPNLFRCLFEKKDMQDLKGKFEVYRDMESVLDINVFSNSFVAHDSNWAPICRYIFYVNLVDSMNIKINLFCNIKCFYVRVFDNDTEKEIKRYTNNVAVENYPSNVNGYTVICYGRAEMGTKVNWKLVLARRRTSRNDALIIPSIPMASIILSDAYIPNADKTICRYIIRVGSDSFLTAHLTTSYDQVNVRLKLIDCNGKTLHQISGVGSALLPVLHLKSNGDMNETSRELSIQKVKKRASSIQNGFSDITFGRQNRKSKSFDGGSSRTSQKKDITSINGLENGSSRSSQKKDITGINGLENGGKRNKKRGTLEAYDADDEISYSSQQSDGKLLKLRKSKASSNDFLEKDPIGEKLQKKSSLRSKSFDKLSQRSAPLGKSRNSNKQGTLVNVMENIQTEYILECQVVGDSWPLTAREWSRVQQLRERDYLNLLEERKSTGTKKSLASKKMEEPFWILDFVYASGDSLEFEQDCSKIERRKQIKMKWFNNIERYQRGVQLRKLYLQEYSEINPNAATDEETARSSSPRYFALRTIREPSIEKFMLVPLQQIDEDTCKIKRDEDFIIEESKIEQTLNKYKYDEEAIEEDTEELMQEQAANLKLFSEWFSEIRSDSAEMILEAMKMTKEYVKKLNETSKLKGDKKAKGKKKKK